MLTKREEAKIEGRRHTGQALALANRDLTDAILAAELLPLRILNKLQRLRDKLEELRHEVRDWPATVDERFEARSRKLAARIRDHPDEV